MIQIELNDLAQVLYDAIPTDRWIGRRELKDAVGRGGHSLNAYDIQQLKHLENAGLIESRKALIGAALKQFEYRRVTRKDGGA